MKLVFTKDKEHQVTVHQEIDGKKQEFSYVDMIRSLLDEGPLELPGLDGDFTEPECKSINRMVEFINEAIESEDEEVEASDDEYDEDDHIDEDGLDEDMF